MNDKLNLAIDHLINHIGGTAHPLREADAVLTLAQAIATLQGVQKATRASDFVEKLMSKVQVEIEPLEATTGEICPVAANQDTDTGDVKGEATVPAATEKPKRTRRTAAQIAAEGAAVAAPVETAPAPAEPVEEPVPAPVPLPEETVAEAPEPAVEAVTRDTIRAYYMKHKAEKKGAFFTLLKEFGSPDVTNLKDDQLAPFLAKLSA